MARAIGGRGPASSGRVTDASDFVARLIRSRPGALSEHFALHWRTLPAAARQPAGLLLLAVPKRQLARAVDRNLVRRIGREAWRGAGLAPRPLALLLKLRRRPEWFAAAGVRAKRRRLREELDALFADRGLARISDTLRGDSQ